MEDVKRQVRRVLMPSAKLMEFLSRRAPQEFVEARLLEMNADVRTGRVILHIETKTDELLDENSHPRPLDHELDWDEIFGVIPCEVCGEPTPVEEITVSRKAGMQMKSEIDRLAAFLHKRFESEIGSGDPAHGESAVDVAIRLLTRQTV